MASTPAHSRGGGNGDGNDNAAGLPTVSPYSTSSDGHGQQRQPPMPAHVVIPSPAMT